MNFCPMNKTYFKVAEKEEFSGSSPPSVFVGSKLYPDANVGILAPAEHSKEVWMYSAQRYWAENNFSIRDVIAFRSSLINSRFRTNIKQTSRFLDTAKEIGMALSPVDVEIQLKKKINFRMSYDNINLPSGPVASLRKVRVTSNIRVPNKIEKVVDDTDLKAGDAMIYLKKDYDESILTQLLSIGVLGLKKNRKLVPTRWSITAVDDSLAKNIIDEIRYFEQVHNYQMYYGHFLGNYYFIMLFPEVFNYELFEGYFPGSAWNPGYEIRFMHDYESIFGRKNYAKNTVGGYYASRLAVLERLKSLKKQAGVLVIRFETPEYWASLGVWVVREAARKTLKSVPWEFENKKDMLDFAEKIIKKKFNYDINNKLRESEIIKNSKNQIKLTFFEKKA